MSAHDWKYACSLYSSRMGAGLIAPQFPAIYAWNATCVSVHDGDTATFDIDRGWSDTFRTPVRFLGCNARELSEPGGPEARDAVAALLPPGTQVVLLSAKADKFGGRIDASITYEVDGDAHDLVADLIAQGWAAPWDATGKAPTPPWPRVAVGSPTHGSGGE